MCVYQQCMGVDACFYFFEVCNDINTCFFIRWCSACRYNVGHDKCADWYLIPEERKPTEENSSTWWSVGDLFLIRTYFLRRTWLILEHNHVHHDGNTYVYIVIWRGWVGLWWEGTHTYPHRTCSFFYTPVKSPRTHLRITHLHTHTRTHTRIHTHITHSHIQQTSMNTCLLIYCCRDLFLSECEIGFHDRGLMLRCANTGVLLVFNSIPRMKCCI